MDTHTQTSATEKEKEILDKLKGGFFSEGTVKEGKNLWWSSTLLKICESSSL
jgi:hypothetical protein